MRELAVVISNENMNVTPIETIDAVIKAGFKNVFIQWYNEEFIVSQEEQVKYIREQGLNIVFAHLGYQNINAIWEEGEIGESLIERYTNDIKSCSENAIPMVIMHLCSKSNPPLFNKIGLDRIRKIVDYAKKLNVKVAFENTKAEGYLEYILSNIDNDNVGICFDSGHCHAHFNDRFNFELFKNHIFAVHLHDNDKSGDQHLLPFDGTIDWNRYVKELKNANYNGPVVLELIYSKHYQDMKLYDYFKKGYKCGKKLSEMFEDLN